MKCPECGAWSLVKETKESPTFGYRRRRECANYHKFTTQEVLVPQEVIDEERRQNVLKAGVIARATRMAIYEGRRKTT